MPINAKEFWPHLCKLIDLPTHCSDCVIEVSLGKPVIVNCTYFADYPKTAQNEDGDLEKTTKRFTLEEIT